jgi:hypothetical protein
MATEELKNEAIKAWGEYGKAIVEAFNIKKGSFINSEELNEAIQNNGRDKLKKLIDYAVKQTKVMKSIE